MRITSLVAVATLMSVAASVTSQEPAHLHGPDGRHIVPETLGRGSSESVLSHHDLRIEGSDGSTILGADVDSTIYRKGEPNNLIHTEKNVYEPEGEVYGSHVSYTQPGEYTLLQEITLSDGTELRAEFPIFVPDTEAKSNAQSDSTPNIPIYAGAAFGAALLLFLAYRLGQKNAKSAGTGALLVFALVGLTLPNLAQASGDDDGHAHGPDGRHIITEPDSSQTPSGPMLRAYTTADGGVSATQKIGDISLVLTIENEVVTPDPDLVAITSDEARIIGLETATVELSDTAGGLKTTGIVTSNPNGVVEVTSRTSGRIVQLGAIPGTTVRSGQMLAVIESPDLSLAQADLERAKSDLLHASSGLAAAESAVKADEARVSSAQQNLALKIKMAEAGEFTAPSLERARSDLSEAKALVESAAARAAEHKSLLARLQQGLELGVVAAREVEEAKADLAESNARLKDAENQKSIAANALSREEEIAEAGLRNSAEVQQAQSESDVAKAGLKFSKSLVQQAKADVNRIESAQRAALERIRILGGKPGGGSQITISAPINGEVHDRHVSVGQTIASGEEMFDLLNTEVVWVLADVYESHINQIAVGQSIEVVSNADPDIVHSGQVAFIHHEVDPATRTIPVRVVIDNPGERLKQNMFVQVILAVDQEQLRLVPSAAVQIEGGLNWVFVEEAENTYRRTLVTVQSTVDGRSIIKGLEPGTTVVTAGSYQLLSLGGNR